jgi:predicted dehydrogenase
MAKAALEAGKHVLCEKPLATSVRDAAALVELAKARKCRNCTCHNLRYYPMVQHMRRMREDGDLGEILVVQGTYSQDWLLYDTDWNWRIDSKEGGPSRALADIGSHWCDMAEHVTRPARSPKAPSRRSRARLAIMRPSPWIPKTSAR